ncbi:hypothetical protein FQA47_021371, partial [Oryzias melastigma]
MAAHRMRDIRCNNKYSVPPAAATNPSFSLTPCTAQIPTSSPERKSEEKNNKSREK